MKEYKSECKFVIPFTLKITAENETEALNSLKEVKEKYLKQLYFERADVEIGIPEITPTFNLSDYKIVKKEN